MQGRARLISGLEVPVIYCRNSRGLYGWKVKDLAEAAEADGAVENFLIEFL